MEESISLIGNSVDKREEELPVTSEGNPSEKLNSSFSDSGSSWWSFVDVVKKKSENLITIYKEDLREFTAQIQTDAKEILKRAPETDQLITSTISSGISGLLGLVQIVDTQDAATSEPEENNGSFTPKNVLVDRLSSRILALQSDLATYCTDPVDKEDFETWYKTFHLNEKTEEISQILLSNQKMRDIHTKLVPLVVSYGKFWERYFYKLRKLSIEEERRAALVKRATTSSNSLDEEELAWEEEEEHYSGSQHPVNASDLLEIRSDPIIAPNEVSSPPANEVEEYFRRMDLKEVNSGSVLGENLKSESIQNLDDSSPVPSSLEKNEVASLDHNGNIDILNTGSQSTTFPLVTNASDDDEQLSLNEEMIIIPKEIQPVSEFYKR